MLTIMGFISSLVFPKMLYTLIVVALMSICTKSRLILHIYVSNILPEEEANNIQQVHITPNNTIVFTIHYFTRNTYAFQQEIVKDICIILFA